MPCGELFGSFRRLADPSNALRPFRFSDTSTSRPRRVSFRGHTAGVNLTRADRLVWVERLLDVVCAHAEVLSWRRRGRRRRAEAAESRIAQLECELCVRLPVSSAP